MFKEKIICNGVKDSLTDCAAIAKSITDGFCAEWYLKSDSCKYQKKELSSKELVCSCI
jgi:hypothetical protein